MYSSDDIRDVLSKPASVKHASSNSLRSVRTRKNSSTRFPTVTNVPPSPPPLIKFSYSFWAPELSWLRRSYLKVMAQTLILTVILVWICILHVWFVDMDGSDIGSAMRTAVQANINTNTKAKLGWIIKDASNFLPLQMFPTRLSMNERGPLLLVSPLHLSRTTNRTLTSHHIVSRNATSNLISARENGDASYNQSTAMVFLYNQGRNEVAANSFIVPLSQALISSAAANFAASYASRYLASQSGNATAMAALIAAPQTLTTPISYSMNNLRPYSAPVASALTLVGSIYTIIFAFVITLSGYAIRQAIEPFLKTKDLLLLRVLAPPIFTSLYRLCFKVPFNANGLLCSDHSRAVVLQIWLWIPSLQHAASNAHTHIQHEISSGSQCWDTHCVDRTLMLHDPLFAFIMRRRAMAAATRRLIPGREPPPTMTAAMTLTPHPGTVSTGSTQTRGSSTESKNDADAEVISIDEKSPAHDYNPPALKSRSDETFDIERQQ
ncbi:hypothetical protein BS47DRAFT_1364082 [Hydnum rufescens UP504]|uniref:DUF3533 domain-containing protein n=1 Tax=Hydnum rufescens UP504 TaxID=1448309 RepID=A0A9P6ATH3_9AGAM|nr:hypothetical protein BS47DRAFT_1364082 [Hydnum rufescens UP504]